MYRSGGKQGQSKASSRYRGVRGSSWSGKRTRPPFRGKVYRVDEEKSNVQVERNYDEESRNLIRLEKQLEVFNSDSSDNYGVKAIDDVTKDPKLAE